MNTYKNKQYHQKPIIKIQKLSMKNWKSYKITFLRRRIFGRESANKIKKEIIIIWF